MLGDAIVNFLLQAPARLSKFAITLQNAIGLRLLCTNSTFV